MIEQFQKWFSERLGIPEKSPEPLPWELLQHLFQHLPEALLDIEGQSHRPIQGSYVIIRPPVYFGPGVRLGDFVKISGPVYLGAGTVVGDYASIGTSYVGDRSVVGERCVFRNSIMGQDTVLAHSNIFITSCLGSRVHVPALTSTANLPKLGNPTAWWRGTEYPLAVEQDGKRYQGLYGCSIEDGCSTPCLCGFMPGAYLAPNRTIPLPGTVVGNDRYHPFRFRGENDPKG